MAKRRGKQGPAIDEPDWTLLRAELDGLLAGLDWLGHRQTDPINLVWGYDAAEDREVVALIVATMAYGRVSLLKKAARQALAALGPHPAATLRELPEAARVMPEGFVYRMTRGDDLNALFQAIGRALREHGSLAALFMAHDDPAADDYQAALTGLVHQLRAWGERDARGFRYLLADPAGGGACKRLNLFLRWVIRGPDQVDLGLWGELSAARLVMPLDTHIVRICTYLGLTSRKTADWKMARQIAAGLRRLDPDDPLKYDFAICHLGISGACPRKPVAEICARCPIERICRLEG